MIKLDPKLPLRQFVLEKRYKNKNKWDCAKHSQNKSGNSKGNRNNIQGFRIKIF